MEALSHKSRFRGLDGWRGIAVVAVLVHHFFSQKNMHGVGLVGSVGWEGVDLFFTLSGFLITGILIDTVDTKGYFKNFYGRRALRLMPLYVVVVLLILAFSHVLQFPLGWRDLPFFAYGANITANLYGTPQGPYMELGHLWSLSMEEQFYFLWPPLVLLLRTPKRVLVGSIVGFILSTALCWLLPLWFPHYLPYEELPTRLGGLLAGAALAAIGRIEPLAQAITPRRMNALLTVGVLGIGLGFYLSHTAFWTGLWTIRIGFAASALTYLALIALAITQNTWAERIGTGRFFSMMGRYSYGFYLFHEIPGPSVRRLIAYLQIKLSSPLLGAFLGSSIVFVLTLALAVLSYHALELPFLKLKKYFAYSDERKDHTLTVDQNIAETVSN